MTTLLIAEHDHETLKDSTNKALTAASQLGGDVHVLVAGGGPGTKAAAEALRAEAERAEAAAAAGDARVRRGVGGGEGWADVDDVQVMSRLTHGAISTPAPRRRRPSPPRRRSRAP